MTIKQLKDVEAFQMMLKLMFRTFLPIDERTLIDYLYKFCEIDRTRIDFSHLLKAVQSLLKDRTDYLDDEKCVQIKIDCKSLGTSRSVQNDTHFCIVLKCGSTRYLIFIENNGKREIHLPVQIKKIDRQSVDVEILSINKKQFENQQIPIKNKKKLLDNFKFNFPQIDLIKGHNFELKYDESKRRYGVEQKSLSKTRLSALLQSKIGLKLKSKINNNFNVKRPGRPANPRFAFRLNWSHFNPNDFPNLEIPIKDQLTKHHRYYVEQHLKLLKYILVRKIERIDNVQLVNEALKDDLKFEQFFDRQLQIILKQNLHEGALNYTDQLICLKQVIKELQMQKEHKKLNAINFKQLLERHSKSLYELSEETFTLSNSREEYLSFLINPFEHANKVLAHDLPFKPKANLKLKTDLNVLCRKTSWPFLATSLQYGKRLQVELAFDFGKMKYQFLDDFDLTSSKVVIWVSNSVNNVPSFYRFSTEKSLNLFDYDQSPRKLCIWIYTSIPYRIVLCILILFEFICFSALPFEYQIYFLPLHVFDALLSIITKGFIFNEFAYMSSFWYYGDGLLTIIYLITYLVLLISPQIDRPSNDYLTGLSMFTVVARVLRAIRELKNSTILIYFRILLIVLGKVVGQLFPLLLLAFFTIIFTSVIAMNTMNGIFNYICFPNAFNYAEFDRIARQTIDRNFLHDKFNFAEQGDLRTNLNQTYFLYDYRPCTANDWYPLALTTETCRQMSDASIQFISRYAPDFLTFDNSYSTFFLILTMIFNSDSDVYFYRIVQHTGLYGYIFCVLLHLFGFYILSLILALICDSYEYQQTKRTIDLNDKIKFFRGEAEFSFKPEPGFMVCYMKDVTEDDKRRLKDLKLEIDRKLVETGDLRQAIQSYLDGEQSRVRSKSKAATSKGAPDLKNIKTKSEQSKLHLIDEEVKRRREVDQLYELVKQAHLAESKPDLFTSLSGRFKKLKKVFSNLQMYEYRQVNILIEYVIWAKFFINLCIFQIEQPFNYAHMMHEKARIFYYLLWIDNYLTLFMSVEILLKILVFGFHKFYSSLINIFDSSIVFINILSFIARLFDLSDYERLLSPFTYLRILTVMYKKWKLLQIISASVDQAKSQIRANIVFYFIIYILLTVVGYRFLSTFAADQQDDDLLQPETNFQTFFYSSITVFYLLFKFEWTPIAFNYLLFNKKSPDGQPMFTMPDYEPFIEYIPFIVEIFLIVSIFVHLFFKELFVPQVIYYLDIAKLLHINPIYREKAKIYNADPRLLFQKEKLKQIFTRFQFRTFLKRNYLFSIYYLCKGLGNVAFYIEILNLFYFLFRDYLQMQIRLNQFTILFVGLALQVYFLMNVALKQIEALKERKFFIEKKMIFWKFLALVFEVSTLIFTIFNIIEFYKFSNANVFVRHWFFECMVWIGLFRIVYYFSTIRDSLKLFLLNISIFSQCLFLAICLLAFMAFIGLSLFKNRLRYCLVIDANWFYQRTKPLGLTNNVFNSTTEENYCISAPYINDIFYFHQLQIRVDKFPHFFNFDTVLGAIETVFHLMNGADLSTIQLITSITGFDEKEKNANIIFWPYVLIVVFLGILIDAFLFSVINELVNQSLPIESIFNKIRNKQMKCVYLAMDSIKQLFPWEDYAYQKRWSDNKYRYFMIKLISSKSYNNLQTIILVVNVLFTTVQWKFDLEVVDFYENLFLINYLLDGVLRINLVGRDIFLHPSLILFDLLFPLINYTLFVSGLRLSNRLLWSTFMFLRFLHPDRYLRFTYLRKSNIIIRTVVNSFLAQLYLIAILAFLILSFSQIGLTLFRHLDYNFLIFEPSQMPYFYSSFFYSYVHLTSIAFTDNYDISTILMRIRNEFCLKTDPFHRYNLLADSQIVKAVDYRLDLDSTDQIEHYNNSLISCKVDLRAQYFGFYLNFNYRRIQVNYLLGSILKSCANDQLIYNSKILNCEFDLKDYSNKIRFMKEFKIELTHALIHYSKSRMLRMNLTFNKVKHIPELDKFIKKGLFVISDQYYDFLTDLCTQLNGHNRYNLLEIDDERRSSNFSKIANWIRLDFLSVFRLIMADKQPSKVVMERICTRKETIQVFYLIFFIISRFFILNVLKAILFKRYDIEKLRDQNNFFNFDVQNFINDWRSFEETTIRKPFNDHLPVDYVLRFVRDRCPPKFRIDEQTNESSLYVLSKYSINCLKLDHKSQMHLLDVMSICIAVHFNCSPTVFHFCYPLVIKHLEVYIKRTFPTYSIHQNKMTSLEQIVHHHYLSKLFILSQLK